MFVGNVAMIIIVAGMAVHNGAPLTTVQQTYLIQNAMVASGIASIVQCYPIWRLGSGLPVIMGTSFTFFAVVVAAATQDYGLMIGAAIIGGIVEGLLGLTAKYWKRYIRPIVSSCVVMCIGISVLPTSITYFGTSSVYEFGAWQNLLVAFVSLLVYLLFQLFGKGIIKQLAVLIGMAAGYVCAICLGMVDFSAIGATISETGVFALPHIFLFAPKFDLGIAVSFILVFIVSATETIGDTSALCAGGLHRAPTDWEISGSLAVDGFMSSVSAGVFGCTPVTSFSQNVGLVNLTGIVNRYSITLGMVILIIAGLCPPIAAVFSTMPYCVLGGCAVMMFGIIIYSGIHMVAQNGNTQRNSLIVAISLGIGVGSNMVDGFYAFMPFWIRRIFKGNMVAGVFVIALLLDLLLPAKIGRDIQPTTNEAKEAVELEMEEAASGEV